MAEEDLASPWKNPNRIYVFWAVALVLLLLAVAGAWIGVPIWRTRKVVADYGRNRFSSAFPSWSIPDADSLGAASPPQLISAQQAIAELGGKARALEALRQYMRRSDSLAPHKWQATMLVEHCGEAAVPTLQELLEHNDKRVREAARNALDRLDAGLQL
jgi:hypothetical protein